MVELRDHLIDAFRDVLSLLVGLEQLTFQGTNAARFLLELHPKARVLRGQLAVSPDECSDDALQPFEVKDVSVIVGNEKDPPSSQSQLESYR